jgi:hypothetical protein
MASIDSIDLAKTVARAGSARAGAGRLGFAPDDTRDTAAGDESGPLFGFQDATPVTSTQTFTVIKEG